MAPSADAVKAKGAGAAFSATYWLAGSACTCTRESAEPDRLQEAAQRGKKKKKKKKNHLGKEREKKHQQTVTMSHGDDTYNLKEVLVTFKSCLTDKQEILMDPYLEGWKGLVSFLNTMGAIFSFVSKDAVSKIQIMEDFRSSDQKDHYETLQSMVSYELKNSLVDLRKTGVYPTSGCRTILRLHRALHWLQLFLESLRTSNSESRTSLLCIDSYNASLANYHPWIIRKTATIAFYALPARETFLENMKVGTMEEAIAMLGEALPSIVQIYDITQALYAQHDLLDLP